MLIEIFLGAIVVAIVILIIIVLKNAKKPEGNEEKLLFETVENLRRELTNTKDKLSDGFMENSNNMQTQLNQTLSILQKEFGDVRKTVDSKLEFNTKNINERLDNAAKVISEVHSELGKVKEMGDSMKSLQDFLRSPKLRGNIGEQILKDMLEQILPHEAFQLQYKFRAGETVDAILKTSNGIIPIDSKFPLENFRKLIAAKTDKEKELARKDFRADVKKHIKDIEKKYILPAEGTEDFALMYIPAESIFYEIAVNDEELMAYASSHHIHPVSPNTLLYYLKAMLLAFSGKKIEENVKKILGTIKDVKQQSGKFGEDLDVLFRHINNANTKVGDVRANYEKLDNKIDTISSIEFIEKKSLASGSKE